MLPPMNGRLLGATLLLALAACQPTRRRERDPEDLPGAGLRAPARTAAPATSGSACEPPAPSASAAASAPGSALAVPGAAAPVSPLGPGDVCRVTRGPVQVPFTGQATLWVDDASPERELRVVYNAGGVPRAVTLPSEPARVEARAKGGKPDAGAARVPERLALSEPAERVVLPPCAFAGGRWFCLDRAGAIHRAAALGQEGPVVAQARPGSPLAAVPIAGSHVLYAFLADRKTTEGAMTLAFVALDDGPPTLLSEDGAGATFVTLAARGEEAVALYIDARRVLTPVHARVLNGNGGARLSLGPDAVLFVGAGSDARTSGVIAQGSPGSEHGLLALERDEKDFGMAAIRIEEQPRDDARVTWSLYPAATERAPLAATQGGAPARVLRVRPVAAGTDARKMLELGELDAAGGYRPSCPVAEGAAFGDPAIAVDRQGAVWLAYTDPDGTWIERRGR